MFPRQAEAVFAHRLSSADDGSFAGIILPGDRIRDVAGIVEVEFESAWSGGTEREIVGAAAQHDRVLAIRIGLAQRADSRLRSRNRGEGAIACGSIGSGQFA